MYENISCTCELRAGARCQLLGAPKEMAVAAVEALKKFVKDSEIKIRVDLNLNKIWESIANADDDALKRNGWIEGSFTI